MLRLERARRGPHISIKERPKDRFLDKRLVVAFMTTCLLHLSACALFKVRSSDGDAHLSLLLPSPVDIDLSGTSGAGDPVSGPNFIAAAGSLPPLLLEPQPAVPNLPSRLETTIYREIDLVDQRLFSKGQFQKMHSLAYDPAPSDFPFVETRPPISFEIGGGLAEAVILNSGLSQLADLEAPRQSTEQEVVTFDVRVSSRTGQVFWTESLQPCRSEIAEKVAREVVARLQFDPVQLAKQDVFVVSGVIEVRLEVDESDHSVWNSAVERLLIGAVEEGEGV